MLLLNKVCCIFTENYKILYHEKFLFFLSLLLLYACSDLELQTNQFPQESQQFSEV